MHDDEDDSVLLDWWRLFFGTGDDLCGGVKALSTARRHTAGRKSCSEGRRECSRHNCNSSGIGADLT